MQFATETISSLIRMIYLRTDEHSNYLIELEIETDKITKKTRITFSS